MCLFWHVILTLHPHVSLLAVTLTIPLTQGHMGTLQGSAVQRSPSLWTPGLVRLHEAVPSELPMCGIFILKGHYLLKDKAC